MVGKKRIEAYGVIYHIIHKGRNGIFKDSKDKIRMLECIGAAKEQYDFLLLAYCIMDNHYHLIIKTHNISIVKIMQSINTRFGKYYSKNYKKTPFKGRYKSIIIEDNEVANLINTIHNEPINYDVVDSMEEYPYISHAFYLMNVDSIVDIDYLLEMLSPDRSTAIGEYSKIMDSIPKSLSSKKNTIELDNILSEICPNKIDFELIKKGSKKSYLMDYKRKFIEDARALGYSTKEIGEVLNISDRAVRKHIHHH